MINQVDCCTMCDSKDVKKEWQDLDGHQEVHLIRICNQCGFGEVTGECNCKVE